MCSYHHVCVMEFTVLVNTIIMMQGIILIGPPLHVYGVQDVPGLLGVSMEMPPFHHWHSLECQ